MKVVLATEMGFCFGVERALELIQAAADRGKPVHTMGDIIHNPQIVADLERRGVGVVERDQPQTVATGVVAVTAHGARPGVREEAEALGLEFMDTTCPLVTKVHKLVSRLNDENYTIVVYGDANHPEVQGTLGLGRAERRGDQARRRAALVRQDDQGRPAGPLAAQAGGRRPDDAGVGRPDRFAQELAGHILPLGGELRVCNTICRPDDRPAGRHAAAGRPVGCHPGDRRHARAPTPATCARSPRSAASRPTISRASTISTWPGSRARGRSASPPAPRPRIPDRRGRRLRPQAAGPARVISRRDPRRVGSL